MMCRQLAYVGRPVPLSGLFYEAPHSLEHQSYAPKEMLEGHVNADGFGVAWYPPKEEGPVNTDTGDRDGGSPRGGVVGDPDEPLVYRCARPAWADPVWNGLSRRLTGRVALMNVRNATDPATAGLGAIHPFTSGRWSFTHNGYLSGFREYFYRSFSSRLSDVRYRERNAASDTQTFFALLLDLVDAGKSGEDALMELLGLVREAALEAEKPSFLNFLFSDGKRVWATRSGTAPRNPTLYVGRDTKRFPGGTVVASEPLDEDDDWELVPQGSLVVVEPDGSVRVRSLHD